MMCSLRLGTEADVDDLVRIWRAIWDDSYAALIGYPMSEAAMGEWMAEWRLEMAPIIRTAIVATVGKAVVGVVHRDRAKVEDLWTDPARHGHGVGAALLDRATRLIALDGYRTATLDCLENNMRARRFYEREGWRPVFREVRPWRHGVKLAFMRYERDL